MSVRIPALLLLGLTTMISGDAFAADIAEQFEAREYVDSSRQKLPYRLLKPKDFGPNKKYPLVLFLHGAGERGTDNKKQLVHGMSQFASEKIMEEYPAFVVSPQCPNEAQWVNVPWSANEHEMPEKPSVPLKQTLELLASLQKEYPIDANRLYITGLSMGGYGAWDAIQRHSDMFAAAAPICGGGDVRLADKIKSVPIWAFHGDQDTVVKPRRSRHMISAIEKAGGSPKYTEYKGVGHDSWTATYQDPKFYEWLFQQKRSHKD